MRSTIFFILVLFTNWLYCQIVPGRYLDTAGKKLAKCGQLDLYSDGTFRYDIWRQNGSCFAKYGHQGKYISHADTLLMNDTIYGEFPVIRYTYYLIKNNRLKYLRSKFEGDEIANKHARVKYNIPAEHAVSTPELKSCGDLLRQY